MRHILFILLQVPGSLFVTGKQPEDRTFFQTNSKIYLYYVGLGKMDAIVYQMGGYFDKAGSGYSIIHTDTLARQADGTFTSSSNSVMRKSDRLFLISQSRKGKQIKLDTAKNMASVNNNLNNAYYLDSYFKISNELNKIYLLNHHSFRNGFYTWEELKNKEISHLKFREFADKRLKDIKDSIAGLQDRYAALTHYLLQNIKDFDYITLRDSLTKLPAEYKHSSWYYGTVINEVARSTPDYYFRLAEDFPDKRSFIFIVVEKDKEVIQRLRAVEGHDQIKRSFFSK